MTIWVPVEALCSGCNRCPDLYVVRSDNEQERDAVREFMCKHLERCICVEESIERARKVKEAKAAAEAALGSDDFGQDEF